MEKQTVGQRPESSRGNDLVYFLVSLCLFIIMVLLASDSNLFFS